MTLHNNLTLGSRDLTYWPSYAMVLNDVMDKFDLKTIEKEFYGRPGPGRQLSGCGSAA